MVSRLDTHTRSALRHRSVADSGTSSHFRVAPRRMSDSGHHFHPPGYGHDNGCGYVHDSGCGYDVHENGCGHVVHSTLSWEWYRQRSGQDERFDKVVDYSLKGNVALDRLPTRLVRHTFVAGERGHGGSITGTNDMLCCIMMEKTSSQNCSRGDPSSEAHEPHNPSHDCR